MANNTEEHIKQNAGEIPTDKTNINIKTGRTRQHNRYPFSRYPIRKYRGKRRTNRQYIRKSKEPIKRKRQHIRKSDNNNVETKEEPLSTLPQEILSVKQKSIRNK